MECLFIIDPSAFCLYFFLSILTDAIYVSFDSLIIQNPKMRTVTMIDSPLHLLRLSSSPPQTDLRDLHYVTGKE